MVCLCKWNPSSSPESVACVGTQVIIAPERLQALIDAWASNDASELHDKFQVKTRTRPRVSESLYSATDLDYTRRLVSLGGQVVSVAISDAVGQSLLELEEGKEQVRVGREAGGSGEMEASGEQVELVRFGCYAPLASTRQTALLRTNDGGLAVPIMSSR